MKKIAIVGSRPTKIWKVDNKIRAMVFELVRKLGPNVVIVSGGAKGVDTWAVNAVKVLGYPKPIIFEADWIRYGNAAGYIRNELIIKEVDEVYAFSRNNSRGTRHSIRLAKRMGKPVHVTKTDEIS